MVDLLLEGLGVTRSGRPLLTDVSLRLQPGELVMLLGRNGAGKTTLLRAALGLLRPSAGVALLGGDPSRRLAPAERARRVAYLPQRQPLAWPNRVRDLVALGRFAHGAAPGQLGAEDAAAVAAALRACDLEAFADRTVDALSGGELARVHCARAFAARAPLLLADEPVAALDPRHQLRVMDLVRRFVDGGGGALVVLHDVELAARFADRLLWLQHGRLIADGTVAQTLTPALLAEVYGVRAEVDADALGPKVRFVEAL